MVQLKKRVLMNIQKSLLLISLLVLTVPSSYAVVKGSESIVSVEPAFTFPAADNDNKMASFGWFKNGFTLEDNSTTCIFDSIYPVSGTINLNGGSLTLAQDLVFKNLTSIAGWGSILGNHHVVELPANITNIPADGDVLSDVKLVLQNDLVVNSGLTFQGNCTIAGNGNSIILAEGGQLYIDAGATLNLQNAIVKGVSDVNVYCVDDAGSLTLDTVTWVQDADFVFSKGSISFIDRVDMVGTATFFYDSCQTSTLQSHSTLNIADGLHFKIGRKTANTVVEPLAFVDAASVLKFDSSSLQVTQYGMQLTKGKVVFDRDVAIDINSTNTLTGIIVGNNSLTDDMALQFNSGSTVTLKSGHFIYNNANMHRVLATSKSACLARDIGSHVYCAQSVEFPTMTLQINSLYTPAIGIADGKILKYNNTRILLPEAEFDVISDRYDQATFYLNGNDSIFLTKGVFPLKMLIKNDGNKLQGNGSIENTITLEDSNAKLILDFHGLLGTDIVLNGGKVTLKNNALSGSLATFKGQGSLDLDKFRFDLGVRDLCWTSSLVITGQEASISLNSKLSLHSTCTFYGNVAIDGNGNTIDLDEYGNIVIADGATLTLRDVRLENVKNNNIRCMSNSSSLILEDVTWVQDADFTFDTGSMLFVNNVDFFGIGTFSYESVQTSTIAANTEWLVRDGLTLEIGKQPGGAQPLWYTDITSVLRLKNMRYHVTSGGMHVTHGTVAIDLEVVIDIDSTSTANGIITGSGNAADDFIIQYNAGSVARCKTGHITFNNINLPSIKPIANKTARLIRSGASHMYFMQSLVLPPMSVELETNQTTPIQLAPGISLRYDHVGVILPDVDFELTGHIVNFYTFGLFGNQSLFLNKGIMPLYAYIIGTGNIIHGTGSMTGAIILSDPTAEVRYGLDGFMKNNIVLNGGTLNLVNNLAFSGAVMVVGPGTVNLSTHRLDLGESDITCASPLVWNSTGGAINLHSQVELMSTWTINGNCALDGSGNTLVFKQGGQIVVMPGTTLVLKNISLQCVVDGSIICVDDTAKIVLDNVEWIQNANYIFRKGSLLIRNEVDMSGAYSFIYDSIQTSSIAQHSHWQLKDGIKLVIGRKVPTIEPLWFENVTSVLRFNNSSFYVTELGMRMTHGTMRTEHEVVTDIASTSWANGITVGTGNVEDDFFLQYDAGSALRFKRGHVTLNNYSPYTFKSAAYKNANFIRSVGSYLLINQNIILPALTIQLESNYIAPLIMGTGKTLNYDSVRIVLPDVEFELNGSVYNFYTSLLAGNQSIFLAKGTLPLYTLAMGTGNKLHGNGVVGGGIILSDPTATLDLAVQGFIKGDITLNGGTLNMLTDAALGRGTVVAGPGKVVVGSNKMKFGTKDLAFTSPIYFDTTQGGFEFNSHATLSNTWTFSGECVIDGRGNLLELLEGGELLVEHGSKVTLRNITMQGIAGNNIRCLDDAGKIILDDVTFALSDDYSFAAGSLQIQEEVEIKGVHTFSYESTLTSTVAAQSKIRMGYDTTFYYNPANEVSNLLHFTNETSRLILAGATLRAAPCGLDLTKGKLIVTGNSYLHADVDTVSENTIIDGGISLGNSLADGDFTCVVTSGATLEINSGSFKYRNTDISSWVMRNNNSFVKVTSDARFILEQNLNLGAGILQHCPKVLLEIAAGKKITGAIYVGM
jgi:hypothetical protein